MDMLSGPNTNTYTQEKTLCAGFVVAWCLKSVLYLLNTRWTIDIKRALFHGHVSGIKLLKEFTQLVAILVTQYVVPSNFVRALPLLTLFLYVIYLLIPFFCRLESKKKGQPVHPLEFSEQNVNITIIEFSRENHMSFPLVRSRLSITLITNPYITCAIYTYTLLEYFRIYSTYRVLP